MEASFSQIQYCVVCIYQLHELDKRKFIKFAKHLLTIEAQMIMEFC